MSGRSSARPLKQTIGRCVCVLTSPGRIKPPRASMILSAASVRFVSTRAMRPPDMPMEAFSMMSILEDRVTRVPPAMARSK
ncbi:MAG: hypothetical protein BWX45_01141 [Deltaproteobacteria bacterium ADurb.Bin002]|nr:MAG: hypothetical protein BWX45_01141 [Deltaproteobacteria bacterium ADurb.Bin002]